MVYVFVAVLGHLALCCTNQQMFTEAERIYQRELSLLKDKPFENRQQIATGQACG